MPDDQAESKLREYNNYTLKWLTIHEALPGHYIQFEHLNSIQPESRRLLRSLFGNGAYVEGWAEYIAQVMMDEGYLNHDPRFRLVMRKIRLRLLANTILDVRMHTMGMTDRQAMEMMTTAGFQTQAEAAGKAAQGEADLDPTADLLRGDQGMVQVAESSIKPKPEIDSTCCDSTI